MTYSNYDDTTKLLLRKGFQEEAIASAQKKIQETLYYKYITENLLVCEECELGDFQYYDKFIGTGTLNAQCVIVGDYPAYDDKNHTPFSGIAGHMLHLILQELQIDYKSIYLTYSIKCLSTLDKYPHHRASCGNHLQHELGYIKPKVIILMGDTALKTYTQTSIANIEEYRGVVLSRDGIYVVPTWSLSKLLTLDGMAFQTAKEEIITDIRQAALYGQLL